MRSLMTVSRLELPITLLPRTGRYQRCHSVLNRPFGPFIQFHTAPSQVSRDIW